MSVPRRPPLPSLRRSRGGGGAHLQDVVLAVRLRRARLLWRRAELPMTKSAVLGLDLARSAWRSMVTVHLGAGNACLTWSKTPVPALVNLGELRYAATFSTVDRAHILVNDLAPTALQVYDL